jgi:integrase
MPVTNRQACFASRPSTHDSNGVAAVGYRRTLIALWLGHESVETTQIYLDANLAIKEEILAKTTPINAKKKGRYQPDTDLLAFLKGL